jgi:hypothetical protein
MSVQQLGAEPAATLAQVSDSSRMQDQRCARCSAVGIQGTSEQTEVAGPAALQAGDAAAEGSIHAAAPNSQAAD